MITCIFIGFLLADLHLLHEFLAIKFFADAASNTNQRNLHFIKVLFEFGANQRTQSFFCKMRSA
jgi:hypothetical protein